MIDKSKLKRRFSRNAKTYDQYASVQKNMGQDLINKVLEKTKNKHIYKILEVGCGTGYVTRLLVKHFPNAKITSVDIANGMIEYTKDLMNDSSVTFICDDIEDMYINEMYDLIISNATFQWFNDLEQTLYKLLKHLNQDGLICFTTFGNQTFRELHKSYKLVKEDLNITEDISPGQQFHSLQSLINKCSKVIKTLNNSMKIKGIEQIENEYFDDCHEFLTSIKKIGANNSIKQDYKVTRSFIEKVIKVYNERFIYKDKVKATYHWLLIDITY